MSNKIKPQFFWPTLSTFLMFIPLFFSEAIYYDASTIYKTFFDNTMQGEIYGVTAEWIYPVAAQLPILTAGFLGMVTGNYISGWMLLVALLNFITMYVAAVKFKLSHKHLSIATFMAVSLSGIFYYRLDIIAMCLTVLAVILYPNYRKTAYAILTVGVFIKIWPLAVIVALWLMSANKIKDIIIVFTYTVIIILPSIIFGGTNVAFSFISKQDSRGIQAESIFAIPLLIQGNTGAQRLESLSFEIASPHAGLVSLISNIILLTTLAAAGILGFTKYWKTPATPKEAYLIGNIIIIVFILFNKVSSTQFSAWLILLLLFTLVYIKPENIRVYVMTAVASTLASGQLYPYLTNDLLSAGTQSIIMLTIKHVMMLILLFLHVKTLTETFNGKVNTDLKVYALCQSLIQALSKG
jgi:hypothetical protein